jgi:hypothetical protein
MRSFLAKSILTSLALELHRRTFISLTSTSIASKLPSDTSPSLTQHEQNSITTINDLWHDNDYITIPLEKCSGGRYCLRVTVSYEPVISRLDKSLSYVPYKVFKLAIDTGSPYLVISDGSEFASFVNEMNSNDQNAFSFMSILSRRLALIDREIKYVFPDSGYAPTIDIYGSQSGSISWKKTLIQISKSNVLKSVVLGVLDKNLAEESGGSLLGLVRNQKNIVTEKVQPRPTLLYQLAVENGAISSFQIDGPNQLLTLSRKSMISTGSERNAISLFDLRPLGDFVDHYAVEVMELKFDGMSFTPESIDKGIGSNVMRKIVAVFDTGLTGCLLTSPLWDDLSRMGLHLKEIKDITVSTKTISNLVFQFETSETDNPYFNVHPINLDWFTDEDTCPYVVVLGQTFLNRASLTIDIDDRKVCFERSSRLSDVK